MWIGLLLYHIFPVLPPALDFVLALEGGETDQDPVSHPQEHCLAPFIIITFMVHCLLLMKKVSFPLGPPNAFPQFLDIVGGCGHSYQSQGKSEGNIDRESGLSPIPKVIGAEPYGGILGTVVSMDQCSNTALPVRLAF